jgi:hypothetical protein
MDLILWIRQDVSMESICECFDELAVNIKGRKSSNRLSNQCFKVEIIQ